MTTPRPLPDIWNDILLADTHNSVDVLASLREESLNDYLALHHKHDNDRYTATMKRKFNANGTEREFTLTVTANKPIQLQFPPFEQSRFLTSSETKRMDTFYNDPAGWSEVEHPDPVGPPLFAPLEEPGKVPDIRVFCPEVKLKLEWPKLDGSDKWEWLIGPLTIGLEAKIALQVEDGEHQLRLEPLRIKFDKTAAQLLTGASPSIASKGKNRSGKEPRAAERGRAVALNDDKFEDLLVIALNVAATQYAPKLVRDIRLPTVSLADHRIYPAALVLRDRTISIGAGLDRPAFTAKAEAKLVAAMYELQAALQEDIEAAGGLFQLVTPQGTDPETPLESIEFLSQDELRKRLNQTNRLATRIESHNVRVTAPPYSLAPTVPNGVGLGVNEYFLDALLRGAMPGPKSECTDWLSAGVVRGRLCWWLNLYNADVTINGTKIGGGISVDVGGAIEACVRKFWDCSWRWECGRLSLAVEGRPGLQVSLDESSGVAFRVQLKGSLRLSPNLPFPFNKVVEAVSGVVWEAVKIVLNVVIGNMQFVLFPPAITFPNQKTKLKLGPFTPFPLVVTRPTAPREKNTFIGYQIGSTADT